MILLFLSCVNAFNIFLPIYQAEEIVITFGIHPFDICSDNPALWHFIKYSFIVFYVSSNIIILNSISKNFFALFNSQKSSNNIPYSHHDCNEKQLTLLIGLNPSSNTKVYVPEKGLYQNFLITGTIGTGKTSSAMYPFTEQLLKYNSFHPDKKLGILLLDVKGNYCQYLTETAKKYKLEKDVLEISLHSNIKYNPLHKPYLSPAVLANRLKTILLLFSENNSESYWLDKVEQILAEAIKLCRLYNHGYVTFTELHKLIMEPDYYKSKIEILKKLFYESNFSYKQVYDLNTALSFFEKEFHHLDSRTLSILKSEITRITNLFISDYAVSQTFCPSKSELNFKGFKEVLSKGKIVVLNMNIAEYQNLSKLIAAYLKLDFQSEVMYNLSHHKAKPSAFICDEYSEYVTKTDANFFSLSREAKCINIICTQSYSSLKATLKDETSVKVITQNLINKIWFRTDDIFTIEEAQKQLGKEDKVKTSTSLSESAKETNFSYITNSLNSKNSNITESFNTYSQTDYVFDTKFFTQNLETFSSLTFLSDGKQIFKPEKLKMFPYFENK